MRKNVLDQNNLGAASEIPQYVLDVEKALGLKCRKEKDAVDRWYVVSPTGVEMFYIEGGRDDKNIGCVSMPSMRRLQGG